MHIIVSQPEPAIQHEERVAYVVRISGNAEELNRAFAAVAEAAKRATGGMAAFAKQIRSTIDDESCYVSLGQQAAESLAAPWDYDYEAVEAALVELLGSLKKCSEPSDCPPTTWCDDTARKVGIRRRPTQLASTYG